MNKEGREAERVTKAKAQKKQKTEEGRARERQEKWS